MDCIARGTVSLYTSTKAFSLSHRPRMISVFPLERYPHVTSVASMMGPLYPQLWMILWSLVVVWLFSIMISICVMMTRPLRPCNPIHSEAPRGALYKTGTLPPLALQSSKARPLPARLSVHGPRASSRAFIKFSPIVAIDDCIHHLKLCQIHSHTHSHHHTSPPAKPPSILLPRPQFLRQIHPHPPRRQSHLLLLIHRHPRVIPLQQGGVHPLRPHVLYILLRFCDLHGGDGGRGGRRRDGVADALLDRRRGREGPVG